jgi:putative transposase
MARKGYTEEQIGFALRQADAGTPVAEICHMMEVPDDSHLAWPSFRGAGHDEVGYASISDVVNAGLEGIRLNSGVDEGLHRDYYVRWAADS